jgi:hypothetical protein
MQLVFLTTHLPSYLDLCGMDPMLSAQALGMIGAFNVLGSLFFGWAGGRWNKLVLLGLHLHHALAGAGLVLHCARHADQSTLVFAASWAFCGWAWRRWCRAGSPRPSACAGRPCWAAWPSSATRSAASSARFGGGLIYTALGNYELAWLGVGIGLAAGLVQIGVAVGWRPPGDRRGQLVPA